MKNFLKNLIALCFITFVLSGCTVEINENAQYIKMYELKAIDDYSKNDNKQIKWFIDAPEALTKEQRVHTALDAAKKCKKENNAQECTIFQVATQNAYMYGDMFYTVLVLDENDKTNVQVSQKVLSKQENNIGFYYIKLRTTYKNATAQEFKKAFLTVMIEKLKIPKKELTLPVMKRENFLIE